MLNIVMQEVVQAFIIGAVLNFLLSGADPKNLETTVLGYLFLTSMYGRGSQI